MAVNFKCTIKNKHDRAPYLEDLALTADDGKLLREGFHLMVRAKHNFPGEATIYRSKRNGEAGDLIPGARIDDFEFSVEEDETIFLVYDKKITVTPGGIGFGAKTDPSNLDKSAAAQGGTGTGGRVDGKGRSKGGSGFGGRLYSENPGGEGGMGIGGTVFGESLTAGTGGGGDVVHRRHPSLNHAEEEEEGHDSSHSDGGNPEEP